MAQDSRSWGWNFGLAGFLFIGGAITLTGCFAIAFSGSPALAQITPDGSLGGETSVVTPNVSIGGLPADRIDGGATRGANLFHSFLEFNVGNGQRVYFANPTGIENILSRVTGNNLSNIFGTLGVNGGANLFLLNPNGIIFGPNARLDIAGSFVASTADSIVFENGTKFSATNPEAPPLLTINVTPGLQYGTNQPRATIANSGSLAVGKDLTLSAGNLDLQGQLQSGRDLTLFAQDTLRVRDSLASPFIAAAGDQLLVQGDRTVDIFALNHPNSGLFSGGDMVLRSANTVGGDAHYSSGGSFRIERLDGGLGSLYSPHDPVIRANGDVFLNSYIGASLHLFAGGSVTIPGTVMITGSEIPANSIIETITLSDGATISIDGSTHPTLDVRAGTTAFGSPFTNTGNPTSANITIGSILTDYFNDGGRVFLTNQYQPNLSLNGQIRVGGVDTSDYFGGGVVAIDSRNGITLTGTIDASSTLISGTGGKVTLLATGDISLTNGSKIISTSTNNSTSSTDYSIITLKSTRGSVFLNQAELSTTNYGAGFAGDISINARDQVTITNSSDPLGIYSNGWAGQVMINAGNEVMIVNSTIATQSNNSETNPFSKINITSTEGSILFDHSQLKTTNEGTGYAGNIAINARDQVAIANGSCLFSDGWAGQVTIKTDNQVVITDSTITSQSSTDETSPFSQIDITATAGSVFLNQAELSTKNFGTGYAGDIAINARDQIAIVNQSSINSDEWFGRIFIGNTIAPKLVEISNSTLTTSTSGELRGGDISIDTGSLSVINGAQLIASTYGEGNAGSVIIRATDQVSFDGDRSYAWSTVEQGASGNGGGIDITTRSLFVTNGAQLNTSTLGQGNAGSVNITATDSVTFDGVSSQGFSSAAGSNVDIEAEGNGGDLNIITGSLSVTNGAGLSTSTLGRGNAGSVSITATGSAIFDGVGSNGRYSGAFSEVFSTAEASGGDINIQARSLSLTNGAQLNANTDGKGNAGHVLVQADDSISLASGSYISSEVLSEAVGNAGEVSVVSGKLTLDSESYLSSDTHGKGNAGHVLVQADGSISLASDSYISSAMLSEFVGQAGEVSVSAGTLTLATGSSIYSNTEGEGDAGNISVQVDGLLSLTGNSYISSDRWNNFVGNAGNLSIVAGTLTLGDGSYISSDTFGQGNAGQISVKTDNSISLTGRSSISSIVDSSAVGKGGNMIISGESLILEDGASVTTTTAGQAGVNGRANAGSIAVNLVDFLSASSGSLLSSTTFGEGDGGNITIQAGGAVSFEGVGTDGTPSGAFTFVGNDMQQGLLGRGTGGNIDIHARSLFLTNGAQVDASTFGQGNAGNVNVDVRETVSLDGAAIITLNGVNFGIFSGISGQVGLGAVGDGGNISIQGGALSMTDFTVVATGTAGRGNAGNVSVQADDFILLTNSSNIRSNVEQGGIGKGGDIDIQAQSLTLTGGAEIDTAVFREGRNLRGGRGQGGNIRVFTSDFVSISGFSSVQLPIADPLNPSEIFQTEGFSSGLFASTERGATGPAGSISITTDAFRLAGGAVVNAMTANSGNAGNIIINANTFEATTGGQVITSTRSSGSAGDITLNINDSITISGSDPTFVDRFAQFGSDVVNNQGSESGLMANTTTGSTGKGGSIFLNSNQVAISNSAKVAVDSQGQGNGGNITIQANSLTLNDKASIVAQTASGEGGNLTLQVNDILLMRHNSLISAEAGGTGNGGNLDIDADFVVAVPKEDSDIVANAYQGRGGNINITTQGIYGLEFRPNRTPLSDITASSQFGVNGVVQINTLGVDPSRGLAKLPTDVVHAEGLIDRHCTPTRGTDQRSSFTVTGRGGLPPSPNDPLRGETVITNWVTLDSENENRDRTTSPPNPTTPTPNQLVEAQGWVIGADGQIILTAQAPTATPQTTELTSPSCQDFQTDTP